jgi:hypothetical protein
MATEYDVWFFAGNHLMKDFDDPAFKIQSEGIRNRLNELAKAGWRVVGQSVLPEVINSFGITRDEPSEKKTLRLVYTLARDE